MGLQALPAALLLLLLSTLLDVSSSTPLSPLPIHLLRPKSGSRDHPVEGISCQSWRLAVETNNLRDWKTIPVECESYVGNYLLGNLYRQDSEMVVNEAITYAGSAKLRGDGKDIWIFDIDETTLSNVPYYVAHGFGAEPYNATAFEEWEAQGKAPALPESLRLYNSLLDLGIKPVFLTGRAEAYRAATVSNLKTAGYAKWEKLLLKGPNAKGSAAAYKSAERKKLVEQGGYTIIGNIGDQWSDIIGYPEGNRTFKLPDPMYYIG